MSALISSFCLIAMIASISACGGSGSVSPQEQSKAPAPIATNEFLNIAKDASCANIKNRLFLIDQKYVLWDKSSTCADASYAQQLYGNSPQTLICSNADSIAGPRTTCTDKTIESLFKVMIQNLDKADLGLGNAHQVQTIAIPAPMSQTIAIKALSAKFYRGAALDHLIIKDISTWNSFWSNAGIKPSISLAQPDFNSKMALVKFYKTNNDCSITRFLNVSSDGQKLTASYFEEERVSISRCDPENSLSSTPIHMLELQKIELPLVLNNVSNQLIISRKIASGSYSKIEGERTLVIRDQESWNKLWQEHKVDDSPQPQVDFSKKMLVAVFLGTRSSGCYDVQDLRAWRQSGKIAVTHYDLEPSADSMCITVMTAPFYIAEIERSNDVVEFNKVMTPAL